MRPPEPLPPPPLPNPTEKIGSAPRPHRSEMQRVLWTAWLCIAVAFAGVAYEFSLGLFHDSIPVWIVVVAAIAVAILTGVIVCARGNVKSGVRVLMATVFPVGLVALLIFVVGGASTQWRTECGATSKAPHCPRDATQPFWENSF